MTPSPRRSARFGGLDVLLYGAADSDKAATVLEMDEAAWDRVIRINLTGAFLMVKAAIPAMIARGGGSVILIASQLGRVASPGRAAYCATKGALIQLAKVLAVDHAAQGIRANTISPGAIETRRMLRRWKDMDEARRMMGRSISWDASVVPRRSRAPPSTSPAMPPPS